MCKIVDFSQEWGTSRVSNRSTSLIVVCQRPIKCHQRDYTAFRPRRPDDLTTLTFSELPLPCLELAGKL